MTATQDPEKPVVAREHVGDRARWQTLRAAARLGQLQPEGFRLVDELHGRHPEWRKEWDR